MRGSTVPNATHFVKSHGWASRSTHGTTGSTCSATAPQGPAGGTSELFQFLGLIRALDPTYADDFWSKPGYLGTEKSSLGKLVRAARITVDETITNVKLSDAGKPASLTLAGVPGSLGVVPLDYSVVSADGDVVGSVSGTFELATRTFTLDSGNSDAVLDALTVGAALRLDNSWAVAFTTYHRHQVPTRSGLDAWNQFRDSAGKPLYPQRGLDLGPIVSSGISGGGSFTGKLTMKVIVIDNLYDSDAFPWQADWYARQVTANFGEASSDQFRLWYNDHADHVDPHSPRLVNYGGLFKQALKDVADWVESGVEPARSTRYSVVGSQVFVPGSAGARRGIQPVVDLAVDGVGRRREKVTVRAGQLVRFHAAAEVPSGAGKIVATGWDFEGTGDVNWTPTRRPGRAVTVAASHRFFEPGVYFVSLRATAQREGDATNPYTPIDNLDTVRVVVKG